VAEAVAVLSTQWLPSALVLLRTLMSLTERLKREPPVGFITHGDVKPENVLASDDANPRWLSSALQGTDDLLWSPKWSTPLTANSALAGIVLQVEDEADMDIGATLAPVRSWAPMVVMGRSDPELIADAAAEGALFISPAAANDFAQAMIGIAAGLDQRIATFETEEDPMLAAIMAASRDADTPLGPAPGTTGKREDAATMPAFAPTGRVAVRS
jgi:hypothetical protein